MNPYQPPAVAVAPAISPTPAPDPASSGLGGWLILVGFGVLISPIGIVRILFETYRGIFLTDGWINLTTPSSAMYNALWAPMIVGEMVVNILMLLLSVYLIFLFFGKKRSFPTWFIRATLLTLAVQVLDPLAFHYLTPDTPIFDAGAMRELGRSVVVAMVWVPYMLMSDRVALTFTR